MTAMDNWEINESVENQKSVTMQFCKYLDVIGLLLDFLCSIWRYVLVCFEHFCYRKKLQKKWEFSFVFTKLPKKHTIKSQTKSLPKVLMDNQINSLKNQLKMKAFRMMVRNQRAAIVLFFWKCHWHKVIASVVLLLMIASTYTHSIINQVKYLELEINQFHSNSLFLLIFYDFFVVANFSNTWRWIILLQDLQWIKLMR